MTFTESQAEKCIFRILFVLLLTSGFGGFGAFSVVAQNGGLDPTFDATELSYRAYGNAVVVQPDGKILVGGDFDVASGVGKKGIARLNADGSPDASFNPNGDGVARLQSIAFVNVVRLQSDGKILIGGYFSSYNGTPRDGLARLNADGTLDSSFQGSAFDRIVTNIEIQPDGKILFSTDGTPLIRLNSDGSADSTFTTNIFFRIDKWTLLSDGKIAVAYSGGASGYFFRRLNADGSFDFSYQSPGLVYALRALPAGKLLVGTSDAKIYKFNADGTRDTNFAMTVGGGGFVTKIDVTADDKILFTRYTGENITRLLADGTVDATFSGSANLSGALGFALQADGKIVITGFPPTLAPPAVPRAVVRLETTGALDDSFSTFLAYNSAVVRTVSKIVVQTDGKILTFGDYRASDGQTRRGIVRLNADGSRNATFAALEPHRVDDFALQPDGKIIVLGKTAAPANALLLVRLNADGSSDPTFVSSLASSNTFTSTALQADGKLLLVYAYVSVNAPTGNVIRLNADGSIDATFDASDVRTGFNYYARRAIPQPDGKILIIGNFTTGTGSFNKGIVRLNANGARDASFNAVYSSTEFLDDVFDAERQPDGRILIGGEANGTTSSLLRLLPNGALDTTFNPRVTGNVTAFKLQSDGKIVTGGSFYSVRGVTRRTIARINADGTPDNFNPSSAFYSTSIREIETQPDGKILVGGDSIEIHGTTRFGIVRLLRAARTVFFDFDGDSKSDVSVFRPSTGAWFLNQTTDGFYGVQFGTAADKIVPADYDGDGRADIAVFRPSNGVWYLNRSFLGFTGIAFGASEDIPVPADYDGDGKADIAVYRPSNGVWYISRSSLGFTGTQFGASGDKPVPADYDGDGKADFAVFRPSNGTWYLERSRDHFASYQFGLGTDKPVPADYDGDGKTDVAVYRNGVWYIERSRDHFAFYQFGATNDVPTPADYDGDGKADLAVFRPSNGVWYLNRSQSGLTGVSFGASDDRPAPNAFVP